MTLRVRKSKKKNLKKEADRVFSIWVRLSARDGMGRVKCFTCPFTGEYKQLQAGHFVPRQYLLTRYDPRNVKPQCYVCNFHYNGQPSAFATNLTKIYGAKIVKTLNDSRIPVIGFNYQSIIDIYTKKLDEMGFSYLL